MRRPTPPALSGSGSPGAAPSRLAQVLASHALLRIASGANAILIGLYLAHLGDSGGSSDVRIVGALSAVSFAAELLASIPMGLASDWLHPRWLMTGGAVTGAFATVLFPLTRSTPVFLLSRALEGLAAAAVVPALLAYLTANTQHNSGLRARVMSYFELSLLAGLAFGGVAASQFFRWLHTGAFAVVAVMYLACAALLFAGTRHGAHAHLENVFAGLRTAWRLPTLRHLAPVWLCVNCIVGLWLGPTFPFLLTRRSASGQFLAGIFAGQSAKIGTLLLGYSIVFGLGVTAWSFVLPRIRVRRAMTITLGAMLPVCVGLFLFNHTPPEANTLRWIIGAVTALGIMVESGFTPAALAWLAGTLPPQAGRGAAMGIYSVLLSLGAILGSLLAGLLGQRYAVDGLLYGTVLVAVAALLLLHWVPHRARSAEAT